jgi:hypothetical protein
MKLVFFPTALQYMSRPLISLGTATSAVGLGQINPYVLLIIKSQHWVDASLTEAGSMGAKL